MKADVGERGTWCTQDDGAHAWVFVVQIQWKIPIVPGGYGSDVIAKRPQSTKRIVPRALGGARLSAKLVN